MQVRSVADCSDRELEQELTRRRLDQEQQLADDPTMSVNVVTGPVGSVYLLDVSVGGLVVSALVDTGSQSTIISRAFLQKVFAHMRKSGETPPRLQEPCTKFRGKGGNPILVTAQVPLTLSVDGRVTSVPVFTGSEQDCLFGSNALPALGISVVRTNGQPLVASSKVMGENETKSVNLVQTTTLPGLNGYFAKAKVDIAEVEGACLLFEPDHKALDGSGISAFESLISVDRDGYAIIPLHNYQGNCVTLNEGSLLGLVRRCEGPDCGQSQVLGSHGYECGGGALVGAVSEDTGHFEKLVEVLGISTDKLSPDQMLGLMGLLGEYSHVFAVTVQELGCTGIVRHSIDTGEHGPMSQAAALSYSNNT